MYKLQIIGTILPEGGIRLWLARYPQYLSAWYSGEGAHRVLGTEMHIDEAQWRLSHLERLVGRAAQVPLIGRWVTKIGRAVVDNENHAPSFALDTWLPIVQKVLRGRIVLEERVVGLLRKEGLWPVQIGPLLDYAVFSGWVEQLPSVKIEAWGTWRCQRCGSEHVVLEPCPSCRRPECPLCLDCISLGESRGCRILLAAPYAAQRRDRTVDFQLRYSLTQAQQRAAEQLEKFYLSDKERTVVWAACGAGKTEVTFPVIRRALNNGEQVLFAIPRQDIVRELAERLASAFQGVEIAVHYGGQPWEAPGDLVVATTHQVLHFYRRFGLVILDEMDAFPYQGSEMLRFGLMRSLAPLGKLIEMSATPNPIPSRDSAITIPARYHGHPLPEPKIVKTRAGLIPQEVVEAVRESTGRWIFFVPTIKACELWTGILEDSLHEPVAACHSRHPERAEQIERFRKGHVRFMVATSVLERGVTFPGVEVVILDADHPIYSRSALVQMAGRVGRTADHPTGRVLFCASKVTPDIRGACTMIRRLNEEAAELGLLLGDDRA